jgi:hypothetical protein
VRVAHPLELLDEGFALLVGADRWKSALDELVIELVEARMSPEKSAIGLYAPRWAVILIRLHREDLVPRFASNRDAAAALTMISRPWSDETRDAAETYIASLEDDERSGERGASP